MIIIEDSRQQGLKHKVKHEWFVKNGIHLNRSALQCGDYQLPGDGSIAIDTKKDIQELIGDIQFKSMSKKDIKNNIVNLMIEYNIQSDEMLNQIYHLITDDDSNRFAEKEISDYCFQNKIHEGLLKEFQNLYIKRHGFFHRGLIRAKNYGIKLYILVENKDGITDINSLSKWVNPRRKITINTNHLVGYWKNGKPKYMKIRKYPNCMMGEQLAKACLTMEEKYRCNFLFVKPEEAAPKIIELLMEGKKI